jgi:hypothetical protein
MSTSPSCVARAAANASPNRPEFATFSGNRASRRRRLVRVELDASGRRMGEH